MPRRPTRTLNRRGTQAFTGPLGSLRAEIQFIPPFPMTSPRIMPSLQMLLLFLAADMALKLTPGPDMALTLTRGMTQGFRTAWFSVLGTSSAGFIQIPLVVLGLAALFQHSPALFAAVKVLGALYLVYLGVRALRRCTRSHDLAGGARAASLRDAYWQGLFTKLLNPNVFLLLVAFLPHFTPPPPRPT